jgi:hypothetical protein
MKKIKPNKINTADRYAPADFSLDPLKGGKNND